MTPENIEKLANLELKELITALRIEEEKRKTNFIQDIRNKNTNNVKQYLSSLDYSISSNLSKEIGLVMGVLNKNDIPLLEELNKIYYWDTLFKTYFADNQNLFAIYNDATLITFFHEHYREMIDSNLYYCISAIDNVEAFQKNIDLNIIKLDTPKNKHDFEITHLKHIKDEMFIYLLENKFIEPKPEMLFNVITSNYLNYSINSIEKMKTFINKKINIEDLIKNRNLQLYQNATVYINDLFENEHILTILKNHPLRKKDLNLLVDYLANYCSDKKSNQVEIFFSHLKNNQPEFIEYLSSEDFMEKLKKPLVNPVFKQSFFKLKLELGLTSENKVSNRIKI